MCVCGLCRFDNFFHGGARVCIADIVSYRPYEKESFLRNYTDISVQIVKSYLPDRHTVNGYLTACYVIKPCHKVYDSGFSCTCFTNDSKHMPSLHLERNVFYDRVSCFIFKGYIFKLDIPLHVFHMNRVFVLFYSRQSVHYLKHS